MSEQVNPPASSGKGPLYIIIAVLVLLLIGGSVGAFVYMNAQEKKEQEENLAKIREELKELKEEKEEKEEAVEKKRNTAVEKPVVKTPPTKGVVSYTGSIGPYSIRMTANYNTGSGSYYYTKHKNKLYLSISRTGNNVYIEERTPAGNYSGYFQGTINPNTGVFSGTFYAVHNNKYHNFRLNPIY